MKKLFLLCLYYLCSVDIAYGGSDFSLDVFFTYFAWWVPMSQWSCELKNITPNEQWFVEQDGCIFSLKLTKKSDNKALLDFYVAPNDAYKRFIGDVGIVHARFLIRPDRQPCNGESKVVYCDDFILAKCNFSTFN